MGIALGSPMGIPLGIPIGIASGGHAKGRKTQVADTTPFGLYNINNTEG